MGKIYCLIGKSGVGKSSLEDLVHYCLGMKKIITCTSRPKRENEVDGVDYYFVSKEEFEKGIQNNDFLEYTNPKYTKWYYGTPKSSIDIDNDNYVCVLNPYGYKQLHKIYKDKIIPIHIVVDKKTRLLRSLLREKEPDVDEIVRRFHSNNDAFKEFYENTLYYPVKNYKRYSALKEIINIVERESGKNVSRLKLFLKYIKYIIFH